MKADFTSKGSMGCEPSLQICIPSESTALLIAVLPFSITVSIAELVWKHFNIIVQPDFNKMVNIPLVNLSMYILKVIRKYVKSTSYVQQQSMPGKEHPSTDTH